ncbi:hypothetical protein B0J15DRAFT_139626 [Fusarium solani]|uniref:Uncharacterized protein n=1 Tax=Fusarium solani TaxID=169388 RepID=A0A9P9K1K7_FUSSL|nr:uncharacterized protein B0J15DRAFT_139626 [Fusarium solani]KAH7240615.1 hypothetical protein B0J15DRAFT_139626 [Fusarium solani]
MFCCPGRKEQRKVVASLVFFPSFILSHHHHHHTPTLLLLFLFFFFILPPILLPLPPAALSSRLHSPLSLSRPSQASSSVIERPEITPGRTDLRTSAPRASWPPPLRTTSNSEARSRGLPPSTPPTDLSATTAAPPSFAPLVPRPTRSRPSTTSVMPVLTSSA